MATIALHPVAAAVLASVMLMTASAAEVTTAATTARGAQPGLEIAVSGDFVPCSKTNQTFQCAASGEVDGSEGKCIAAGRRCDGKEDCPGGADEEGCPPFVCGGSDMFVCKSTRECISRFWVCDKEPDCSDGSDEEDCTYEVEPKEAPPCKDNEFKCGRPTMCIPDTWRCDESADCFDGSDEEEEMCRQLAADRKEKLGKLLAERKANGTSELSDDGAEACPDDSFQCESSGHCFPQRFRCDGVKDCLDGSDEDHCGGGDSLRDCNVENNKFLCQDRSRCLPAEKVCDQKEDCEDGSDELSFCKLTCENKNCQHSCLPGNGDGSCYCHEGYRKVPRNDEACEDVDECSEYGRCSQFCNNTVGGFECSCDLGYIANGTRCELADPRKVLIFSTKSEIRMIEDLGDFQVKAKAPVSTSLDFHPEDTGSVIGLDYDSVNNRVYWTSTAPGREGIMHALIHGRGEKAEFLARSDHITNPEGLAFDYIGRNMYFTHMVENHTNSYVGVVNMATHKWAKLIKVTVQKPRGVAVYPEKGLLFYTEWGNEPGLVRANMDGTGVTKIVREGVKWINGVAVDKVLDRLYWTDANHDRIETSRLDGTDRRLVLEGVSHPVFISVFGDSLFWSDWKNREILSCNKFTGRNLTVLYKEPSQYPTGLTVYHPLLHPIDSESPCQRLWCSDLCLLTAGGRAVCHCSEGAHLDKDGQTCIPDEPAVSNKGGEEEEDEGDSDESSMARVLDGASEEDATSEDNSSSSEEVEDLASEPSTAAPATTTTTTTTSTGMPALDIEPKDRSQEEVERETVTAGREETSSMPPVTTGEPGGSPGAAPETDQPRDEETDGEESAAAASILDSAIDTSDSGKVAGVIVAALLVALALAAAALWWCRRRRRCKRDNSPSVSASGTGSAAQSPISLYFRNPHFGHARLSTSDPKDTSLTDGGKDVSLHEGTESGLCDRFAAMTSPSAAASPGSSSSNLHKDSELEVMLGGEVEDDLINSDRQKLLGGR